MNNFTTILAKLSIYIPQDILMKLDVLVFEVCLVFKVIWRHMLFSVYGGTSGQEQSICAHYICFHP